MIAGLNGEIANVFIFNECLTNAEAIELSRLQPDPDIIDPTPGDKLELSSASKDSSFVLSWTSSGAQLVKILKDGQEAVTVTGSSWTDPQPLAEGEKFGSHTCQIVSGELRSETITVGTGLKSAELFHQFDETEKRLTIQRPTT